MDLVECTIEALPTMDCLFGVHRVPRELARVISKTIQWLSKPGGLFCPPVPPRPVRSAITAVLAARGLSSGKWRLVWLVQLVRHHVRLALDQLPARDRLL